MFLIFSHNLPLTSRSLTLGLICTPVSPYTHMLCTQLLASVPEHQSPETNRSSGSGEKASGRKSIDIVLPSADLSPENAATSDVGSLASPTEARQSSGVDGTARSTTAGATAAAPGLSVVTLEARQLGRKLMMANELVVLDAAATAAAAPKSPPPSPVNHSPTVLTRGVSAASADQRRHLCSTPAAAATLEPVKLTTLSVKPRSATTANSSIITNKLAH